jgi:hypothetical protein
MVSIKLTLKARSLACDLHSAVLDLWIQLEIIQYLYTSLNMQ